MRYYKVNKIEHTVFDSLDEVPLDKIIAFEKALHEFSSDKHSDLVNEINTNCDYNDEVAAKLKSLMEDFKEKGVY